MELLEQLGIVPVDSGVLRSLFADYSSPHNKIARLEQEGKIVRLKRGLYVVSSGISRQMLSEELIANHLYGPSYVSLESALRYYGLIPERVYTVRSMTVNRLKRYDTPLGRFEFVTVSDAYYPIGICQQFANNHYPFLIATPEKALCDLLVVTPRLKLQSLKALDIYLEEDIRFDTSALVQMNPSVIEQCLITGKKQTNLKWLLKRLSR